MTERRGPRAWRTRYAHPCAWEQTFPPLAMTEMFARSVAAHADRPLLDFFGRIYHYRDIWTEARAFAAGLQRDGLGAGDRIGLFLPNVPIYLSAYFGAMMAGATVVNFSPLYTAAELEAQIADSGTRLMVTLDVPALLPTAVEVLRDSGLERLVVASLSKQLPHWQGIAYRLFRRGEIAAVPDDPAIRDWPRMLGDPEACRTAAVADPETVVALLQYTGGTTGAPKGAMLSHQNLTVNARQILAADPHRGERDVMLGALPFFHVFANACVLNRTVLDGGCIAMLPRFRAGQALKTIARTRVTTLPGVPTMYQALLDDPAFAGTDFSSLRTCISGGAPLSLPLKQEFEARSGAHLMEGYGLTETSGVASANPFYAEGRAGTIGHPFPATDMRLLDRDDPTRDAAPNEAGELAVAGPQIMLGYWNRPDAATSCFVEREGTRWLRTGDIATIDADGWVRIVDRSKDMIAVGGFKVFPSQIEHVLVGHPAVKEALVIGVPDRYHGEIPRAFVSLQDVSLEADMQVSGEELRDWLNPRLGKHERVDRVVIRDALPKTMVGKLDRKALRAQIATPQIVP